MIEDFFAKRNEVREQLKSVSIHVAETTDELTSRNNANELLDILEELDEVVDVYVRKNNESIGEKLDMKSQLNKNTHQGYEYIVFHENTGAIRKAKLETMVTQIIPKSSKEIFFFKFLSKLKNEKLKKLITDLMTPVNSNFSYYANEALKFTKSDSELTYDI